MPDSQDSKRPIIPCEQRPDWARVVNDYALALREAAHTIGTHGFDKEAFDKSGLFRSAVERIRGQQAATTSKKYAFIEAILKILKEEERISEYSYAGGSERHDYEVTCNNGRICCIEAKGCLDGNNTNIYVRPQNADEFVIWSLCQNPGADPRNNAWSGIHTRLSAEIIARRELVDGLIIWDMLCGTPARPCPKLAATPKRSNAVGEHLAPPPCIYLFPRTVPDPRNNPKPPSRTVKELTFIEVLAAKFQTLPTEIVSVGIEARMNGATVERKTTISSDGQIMDETGWTPVRRAR